MSSNVINLGLLERVYIFKGKAVLHGSGEIFWTAMSMQDAHQSLSSCLGHGPILTSWLLMSQYGRSP